MSEVQEITIENVTIETLSAVKYGNLLETLTKLGVEDCWKPGTKATVMVQDAIEKLAVIKSMKEDGKTEKQIEAKLAAKEAKKEDIKKAATLKAAEKEAEVQEATVEEVKVKKLTEKQVEWNLASIEKNLANGIDSQREILLKKKAALIEIQENKDYFVEELSDEVVD